MPKGVAIFDFDRTLVQQETMAMFLRLIAGNARYFSACCMAAAKASLAHPKQRVGVFRIAYLHRNLRGKTVTQAEQAAEQLFPRISWNENILADLRKHQDEGRKVLIATGSLSIYMPTLLSLKGLSVDGLLSTEMEVFDGVLTGQMLTPSCTWDEKAKRVKAWLEDTAGPIWGYGNMPPDGPMLDLTDHPLIVPT